MRVVVGGAVCGTALMQAPFQKLGGCAVLREGRGAGAAGGAGVVGVAGGGCEMGLAIVSGVRAGGTGGCGVVTVGVVLSVAVGGEGGGGWSMACCKVGVGSSVGGGAVLGAEDKYGG